MKTFVSIFLILIVALQTFSLFVAETEYYLNKSYIAKNLCENTDKPDMHCNGKCYLNKKLNQQENSDQQTNSPRKDRFQVSPFFLPKVAEIKIIYSDLSNNYGDVNIFSLPDLPHSIFHPPSA